MNERSHLRNVFAGFRMIIEREDVQLIEAILIGLDIEFGKFFFGFVFLFCLFDDLIIDIGVVADAFDIISALFEDAGKQVKGDSRSKVS